MKNKAHFITLLATLYVLIYVILINRDVPFPLIMSLFAISPLVIIYTAFAILKFDIYNGPELKSDEWGYQDAPSLHPEREDDSYDGLL